MAFIGTFHPLLVHFPIALVLAAAAAELVVITTSREGWHTVAVANLSAGAAMGVVTVITGWLFASSSPVVDATTFLEWHRWLGLAGAVGAISAALLSLHRGESPLGTTFVYRLTLFVTALVVGVTAHLGGTLAWGAGFLRP